MKRNRILYLLLLFLSFIFIYFYGGKLPYMLFFTAITLPVVSLLYSSIIYLRFKYVQDVDKRQIIKGDKVNLVFDIINEDIFLYPYIKVNFFGTGTIFSNQFHSQRFSIQPFKNTRFAYELECKYRGCYNIGIQSIEIEDFLGIFNLRYSIMETRQITVYPKIVYLDRFSLKTNFQSEVHSILDTKLEDMTTVSDMRKYAYGDSLRRIHWKLSAKRNELISRNFQSTSQTCATLFLDLHRLDFPVEYSTMIEDKLIDAAGAVIYYCLSNWIPIRFIYYADRIVDIEAKSMMDFDEIYKILSRITFHETVEVKDIMDVCMEDSIHKTNMLVFTSRLSYDLYNEIHKSKFSGHEVSLIHVSPRELTGFQTPEEENILRNLPEIGVSSYLINMSDDIKLVLENRT